MKERKHFFLKVFVFLSLFACTFALSGYWIVTNPQRPLPDPTLYEGIGFNLASGNGYSFDRKPPYRPELTRTPFLPSLIAVIYKIFGRHPKLILWTNALFIGLAVGMGYLVALKLFRDQRIAILGGIIAFATPPVTGTANNILTEPPAMVQLGLAILLLLNWPKKPQKRKDPLRYALFGLLLASIVLNRSSMTLHAIIAGAYVSIIALRGNFKSRLAWLNVFALCFTLGAPVLLWSARNASLGLAFSPAPLGLAASRVFDIKRYREHFLEPGEKLPAVNARYFLHWRKRYGPETLRELERQNHEWFQTWYDENKSLVFKTMPYRFVGLFSFFRNSIYPPWPAHKDRDMREVMRWISRVLWLFSLAGLMLSWNNKRARYIWLVTLIPLVFIHLATVCHSRYLFPLLPYLIPYGAVVPVKIIDIVKRRAL